MRPIFAAALLFLCADSFALNTELRMAISGFETKLGTISKGVEAQKKQLVLHQSDVNSFGAELKKQGCVLDSNQLYDCSGANPMALIARKSMLEGIERRHRAAKAAADSSAAQIQNLQTEHSTLTAQLLNDRETLATGEAVEMQKDVSWLLHDFSEIRNKHYDIGAQLDEFERLVDKSSLGVYLQDKIGLLLSSNAICNASQRCKTGERKELDKSYLKEVFPEMNDENSRSGKQLYDKAAGRRSAK